MGVPWSRISQIEKMRVARPQPPDRHAEVLGGRPSQKRSPRMAMTTIALQMLEVADAAHIQHPGGTLMAHLQRVKALLDSWGAHPALAAAGLCHAFYGTDGFPAALLDLEHRADLAKAIGTDAEEMAYFYASCDRKTGYRSLADEDGLFVDRFTGTRFIPGVQFAHGGGHGRTVNRSSGCRCADTDEIQHRLNRPRSPERPVNVGRLDA
jgi:hypothetical protein